MGTNTELARIKYFISRNDQTTDRDIAHLQANTAITVAGIQQQSARELGVVQAIGNAFTEGVKSYYTNKREEERYAEQAQMTQLRYQLDRKKAEAEATSAKAQLAQSDAVIRAQDAQTTRTVYETNRMKEVNEATDILGGYVARINSAGTFQEAVSAYAKFDTALEAGGELAGRPIDSGRMATVIKERQLREAQYAVDGDNLGAGVKQAKSLLLKDSMARAGDRMVEGSQIAGVTVGAFKGAAAFVDIAEKNKFSGKPMKVSTTDMQGLLNQLRESKSKDPDTNASMQSVTDQAISVLELTLNERTEYLTDPATGKQTDVLTPLQAARFNTVFGPIAKHAKVFDASEYKAAYKGNIILGQDAEGPEYLANRRKDAELKISKFPLIEAKQRDYFQVALIEAMAERSIGTVDLMESYKNSSEAHATQVDEYNAMKALVPNYDTLKMMTGPGTTYTPGDEVPLDTYLKGKNVISLFHDPEYSGNVDVGSRMRQLNKNLDNVVVVIPMEANGESLRTTGKAFEAVKNDPASNWVMAERILWAAENENRLLWPEAMKDPALKERIKDTIQERKASIVPQEAGKVAKVVATAFVNADMPEENRGLKGITTFDGLEKLIPTMKETLKSSSLRALPGGMVEKIVDPDYFPELPKPGTPDRYGPPTKPSAMTYGGVEGGYTPKEDIYARKFQNWRKESTDEEVTTVMRLTKAMPNRERIRMGLIEMGPGKYFEVLTLAGMSDLDTTMGNGTTGSDESAYSLDVAMKSIAFLNAATFDRVKLSFDTFVKAHPELTNLNLFVAQKNEVNNWGPRSEAYKTLYAGIYGKEPPASSGGGQTSGMVLPNEGGVKITDIGTNRANY